MGVEVKGTVAKKSGNVAQKSHEKERRQPKKKSLEVLRIRLSGLRRGANSRGGWASVARLEHSKKKKT